MRPERHNNYWISFSFGKRLISCDLFRWDEAAEVVASDEPEQPGGLKEDGLFGGFFGGSEVLWTFWE